MKLVTTPDQAIANIEVYNAHADKFADLMPRARAWYAIKGKSGWLVAPSKVIGYQDLDPDEYLARDMDETPLDGRITESVLQSWATLIEEGNSRHRELRAVLNELCARFGKKPNSLARISIMHGAAPAKDNSVDNEELVKLLAGVFRTLSPAQKSAFQRLIAA